WSIVPSGNVGPEQQEIVISTVDVGSESFQIALFFGGDSHFIFNWDVDDFYLSGGELVSINELSPEKISIYPNPSRGIFNISVKDNFNLEVSDVTGKMIDTHVVEGNTTIQISTSGVYFLRFSNDDGSVTQKVVVR
ncbi:MAG: T9SS type A sorting domain-containing protein, partial [Bacteroidota bacterium]